MHHLLPSFTYFPLKSYTGFDPKHLHADSLRENHPWAWVCKHTHRQWRQAHIFMWTCTAGHFWMRGWGITWKMPPLKGLYLSSRGDFWAYVILSGELVGWLVLFPSLVYTILLCSACTPTLEEAQDFRHYLFSLLLLFPWLLMSVLLNTSELYLLITVSLSQSLADRNKGCGFFFFLTVPLMLLSFLLIRTKQIRLSVPDGSLIGNPKCH